MRGEWMLHLTVEDLFGNGMHYSPPGWYELTDSEGNVLGTDRAISLNRPMNSAWRAHPSNRAKTSMATAFAMTRKTTSMWPFPDAPTRPAARMKRRPMLTTALVNTSMPSGIVAATARRTSMQRRIRPPATATQDGECDSLGDCGGREADVDGDGLHGRVTDAVEATDDDGGCEYAPEGYDCDGNPLTSGVSDLQPTPTITAFPNPSFGRFAIRGLQGEGPHDLMVLDLHGRLLRRERIVASPQADG